MTNSNDFLHEQIIHISKSGAYDVLSKSYGELTEKYKNVRADLNKVLDELQRATPEEVVTNPAALITRISRICLDSLKNNRP